MSDSEHLRVDRSLKLDALGRIWRASLILLIVLLAPAARAQDGGFMDLFNGEDLSGWVEMGEPGAFLVEDGVLVLDKPNNYPNWLRSERQYENFVLQLEYQTLGWAEGGIYLHAPLHGDPLRSGIKIHLRHDRTEEGARSAGALYDVRPPIVMANKTDDAWNELVVTMDWPRLRVELNDVLVQDVNMERSDELRWRLRRGYIGFEDLGQRFRFRNVQIKELPGRELEWTPIFNGRDLTGWEAVGDAEWEVNDGVLSTAGGEGVLRTEERFSGYELQLYFRTTTHANGGVFYRMDDRSDQPGHYEIQVYDVPTATNPTGSIYGVVPAADSGCRSEMWCFMQLISDGAHSRVLVNGKTVAEAHDLTLPDSGRVGIQSHSRRSLEFKDIRIKSIRD